MSIFSVTRILILLAWAVCASAVAADNQSRYRTPYPVAASKKGLQVELVEDALTLGVKHAGAERESVAGHCAHRNIR